MKGAHRLEVVNAAPTVIGAATALSILKEFDRGVPTTLRMAEL